VVRIGSKAERQSSMRIQVRLYASLQRFMPGERDSASFQDMELDEGTTVAEFLHALHVPADTVKLIFLNGIRAEADQILKEGDRLGVFPPVAGG
jgi:molybdopterin synthase sulfur carrier subunit